MSSYIPSPQKWVAEQVEQYEKSGGTEGLTLRDTVCLSSLLPITGGKQGAIRKTPVMRAVDGDNYILVASKGGAPQHPEWYYNLMANPEVEIRDQTEVHKMRVREVIDPAERSRLWDIAVKALPTLQTIPGENKTDYPGFSGRTGGIGSPLSVPQFHPWQPHGPPTDRGPGSAGRLQRR